MPNNQSDLPTSSSMNTFIDHYCERLAPGFFGEPLNAISNLAIIIVGFLLIRKYLNKFGQFRVKTQWDIIVLLTLVFLVGIGSTLWHILAVAWALKADVIPILLFINLYFLSCLFRVFEFSWKQSLFWFFVYHMFNSGLRELFPDNFLNGSIFYLPTLITVLVITLVAYKRRIPERQQYLFAFMAFCIALIFRTFDNYLCQFVTSGTHFVWHILIAVMIYALMQALMSNTKPN